SIARMGWAQGKLVHFSALMDGEGHDDDLSLTDPSSISLALSGQVDAVIEKAGATSRRRIVPGDIMLCGPEPIRWLGGSGTGATEFIEVAASPDFRREIAGELGVPQHADLDDRHGWSDPVVSAIAGRLSSAARQTIVLDDLERD